MTNIAKERIDILFDLADKEFENHIDRSRRYVQLARKIGLRYNVRLSETVKKKFCKHCNTLLKPGNSKTRLDKTTKTIMVICLNCKKAARHPYN